MTFENTTIYNNVGGMTVVNGTDGRVFLRIGTVIRDNSNAGLHLLNCQMTVDDQAGGTNWSILRNGLGISSDSCTLTLDGLAVTETNSYAVHSTSSDLTVRNCTLTGRDGIFLSNNTSSIVESTSMVSTFTGVSNWGVYRDEGDLIVRNTVVEGFQNGIYLTVTTSLQADVLNTTVVNASDHGIKVDSGAARAVNTIVAGSGALYGIVDNGGQLTHSNNLIHGFATPFTGTAQHVTEILKSPRFVDEVGGDFRLGVGSPAINAGMDLSVEVANDMDSNSRPSFNAFEIGAYEYLSPTGSLRILSWKETSQ